MAEKQYKEIVPDSELEEESSDLDLGDDLDLSFDEDDEDDSAGDEDDEDNNEQGKDDDGVDGSGNEPEAETVEPEIRTITVMGYKVRAKLDKDGNVLEAESPKGLSPEKLKRFERKLAAYEGGLAALNRKNREKNLLEEQRETNRLLRESMKPNGKKEDNADGEKSAKFQAFGLEKWSDIEQLKIDDPDAWEKGMDKYHDILAEQKSQKTVSLTKAELEEKSIQDSIVGQGYKLELVQAYQKQYGINNLKSAFDLYKDKFPLKKGASGTDKLVDTQRHTPKLVKPGGLNIKPKETKSPGQIEAEKQQKVMDL